MKHEIMLSVLDKFAGMSLQVQGNGACYGLTLLLFSMILLLFKQIVVAKIGVILVLRSL